MVVDIKIKILIKSGTPDMLYVELRAKKLFTVNACAQVILILRCTEHASTTLPVDDNMIVNILDKGTVQVWKFRDDM